MGPQVSGGYFLFDVEGEGHSSAKVVRSLLCQNLATICTFCCVAVMVMQSMTVYFCMLRCHADKGAIPCNGYECVRMDDIEVL